MLLLRTLAQIDLKTAGCPGPWAEGAARASAKVAVSEEVPEDKSRRREGKTDLASEPHGA